MVTTRGRARFVPVPRVIILGLVLAACDTGSSGDDAALDTGGAAATGTETGLGDDDPTAPETDDGGDDSTSPDPSDPQTDEDDGAPHIPQSLPPTNAAELAPWLQAGSYADWTAESDLHPSSGPHFGAVRTFVNDALLGSLESGAAEHPEGAATVKELYGGGDTVLGWSVMVKVAPDSTDGDGWYWYEAYGDSVYADATGAGTCTGCHAGGHDYVLSPFPLQ